MVISTPAVEQKTSEYEYEQFKAKESGLNQINTTKHEHLHRDMFDLSESFMVLCNCAMVKT
jgi:hypothetical protein